MSITANRRLSAAVLAVLLPVSVVACGSSDDKASTTTKPAAQSSQPVSGDDATTTADAPDGSDAAECVADTGNLSGSSTVLFSGDVDTGQTEADITPDLTMTVDADGTADPATLTVPVDTMFGIALPKDADLTGFTIGCATGQTAIPGVTVGFLITTPGTYVVSDDLAGTDVGKIVVE